MYNISFTPDGEPKVTYPSGVFYLAGGDDSNCTISVCPVELSVYGYRASLPFSATAIALFALCAIVQVYLGWKHKTWSFLTAMLFGCFCELLGYVGRIMMWQNPWNSGGFTMQIGMQVHPRDIRNSLTP